MKPHVELRDGPGLHHGSEELSVPSFEGHSEHSGEEVDREFIQGPNGKGLISQQALEGQVLESGWDPAVHLLDLAAG